MSDVTTRLLNRLSSMEAERGTLDSHNREIAERVLPRSNVFNDNWRVKGDKRTEFMYDSTAALALERFAAMMDSLLTPRTKVWHKLTSSDPVLLRDQASMEWFELTNHILYKTRYNPGANFASQQNENYMSLGAFGTAAMFIEQNTDPTKGLFRYKSMFIGDFYIAENHQGLIDTMYRKFRLTARAAQQRWPDTIPQVINTSLEKEPDKQFEFVNVVQPNNERLPGVSGPKGMKFVSYNISVDARSILSTGGFNTFPYAVSRYVTAPNEVYGRSPAMLVLADIKMLNAMNRTGIRAAQKAVDPPVMLHGKKVGYPFRQTPGAGNYDMVNDDGKPLAIPFINGTRQEIGFEWMSQKRASINDAFLVTLFQILIDTPQMTATEVLQRAREKGILLTPTMGRQQSENLGPMIEREISILQDVGKLPPLPPALIEAEGEYDIIYESDLSRAQTADEVDGFVKWQQVMGPVSEVDPSVWDSMDLPRIARETAPTLGVPARWVRSEEAMQKLAEQRAQQSQIQQTIDNAPDVAKSIKMLSDV